MISPTHPPLSVSSSLSSWDRCLFSAGDIVTAPPGVFGPRSRAGKVMSIVNETATIMAADSKLDPRTWHWDWWNEHSGALLGKAQIKDLKPLARRVSDTSIWPGRQVCKAPWLHPFYVRTEISHKAASGFAEVGISLSITGKGISFVELNRLYVPAHDMVIIQGDRVRIDRRNVHYLNGDVSSCIMTGRVKRIADDGVLVVRDENTEKVAWAYIGDVEKTDETAIGELMNCDALVIPEEDG